MKTIGLIGGMSWESTADYYRLLNQMTRERLGGLHSARLILYSFDFQEIESYQTAGKWDIAAERLAHGARTLERAGAECLLLCTNTMHKVAAEIDAAVAPPLLHIADAVGAAMTIAQLRRPLLLGTRFTMEQDFYSSHLQRRHAVECLTPNDEDRATVHRVIYEELCKGRISPDSRRLLQAIIAEALTKGADSVLFGCTELGLLLSAKDVPAPVFDSTQLHVIAALDYALAPEPLAR